MCLAAFALAVPSALTVPLAAHDFPSLRSQPRCHLLRDALPGLISHYPVALYEVTMLLSHVLPSGHLCLLAYSLPLAETVTSSVFLTDLSPALTVQLIIVE